MNRFFVNRLLPHAALVAFLGTYLSCQQLAIGRPTEVPNFNLQDLNGRNHELRRAEGKAVVLFFTGNGCPIARQSVNKLKRLQERFGKDVTFWLVNTYTEDSLRDCRNEFQEYKMWPLTYLRDPKQGLATTFGVERTATVVAIGTADWSIFYQGAIDDQLSEGSQRAEPNENLLQLALQEFLDGKTVSTAKTRSHGCRIAFAFERESGAHTSYAKDVAPVLQKHCVPCHREGGIGPWNMDAYGHVKNNSKMIQEVLLTAQMPPWHADPAHGRWANERSLNAAEMQKLLSWISEGAVRDNDSDPLAEPLPSLPEWPLGKPDFVIALPKPEQIPANGVLDYRHVRVDLPVTNEIWLAALDVKPGNRKVLHHVIIRAKSRGGPDDGSGNGLMLAGWAPGLSISKFADGTGKRIPAGAKIDLELHYTTTGTPQTDQTEVAFYLLPEKPPREVTTRAAAQLDLNIPPGTDESRDSAIYGFERPATLYSFIPHMHLRGRWMQFELLQPDGKRETLLRVPRYDFNWQTSYQLAEPRHVAAGSWLLVTGGFDNSTGNPANPDPKKRVHFGQQSWDEMFIGFFDAADDPDTTETTSVTDAPAATGLKKQSRGFH
jgi:peroxiredoxin